MQASTSGADESPSFFYHPYTRIDLVLNFFTAYWEPGEDDDFHYITSLKKIRANYLRTWFLIDFFAVLPVEYNARDLQAGYGPFTPHTRHKQHA